MSSSSPILLQHQHERSELEHELQTLRTALPKEQVVKLYVTALRNSEDPMMEGENEWREQKQKPWMCCAGN